MAENQNDPLGILKSDPLNILQKPSAPTKATPIIQPGAPVSKYQKAINDDRSEIGKTLSTLYNNTIASLERFGGAIADLPAQFNIAAPGFAPTEIAKTQEQAKAFTQQPISKRLEPAKQLKQKIGKAADVVRSGYTTREEEKAMVGQFNVMDGGIGLKDIQSLIASSGGMALDMGLGAVTGGTSFVLQGYNDAVEDYDAATQKAGIEQSEGARGLYGIAGGVINGLLEKFAVDKIVGDTPIFKNIQKKAIANVLRNTAGMTGKKAVDAIETAAVAEIKKLTSDLRSRGVRAAYRTAVEGGTEAVQAALEDGAKLAANLVQGNEAFNEDEIRKGFFSNMLNAGVAGGIMGPIFGAASDKAFGRNVNTQVLKDIAEANTPEQLAAINDELAATFDKNNFTQEERDAVMANANRYAQIKQTLPEGTNPIAQTIAIPLIENRIKIDNEIQSRRSAMENFDEALKSDEEYAISVLEDKKSQINDDIREVVNNEKFDYFEKDGKFYKKLGENAPEEISKNRFDLQQLKTEGYATTTGQGPVQEGGTAGDIGQRQGAQEGGTQEAPPQADTGYRYIVSEEGSDFPVRALVNKKVRKDGRPAILYQEGQRIVARILGTNRIEDVGNVVEMMDALPQDFGIEADETVVTETPTGYRVEGEDMVNDSENPLDAISVDQNGNVKNVVLKTPAGKRRKFRGQAAQDLAYQITLKETLKNEDEFELFLEQEHQAELDAAEAKAAAEAATNAANEPVPTVEESTEPTTEPTVTTEPTYGRFTIDNINDVDKLKGFNKLQNKVLRDVKSVVNAIVKIVKAQGNQVSVNIHDQDSFEKAVIEAGGSKEDSTSRGFYMAGDGSIHLNMDNLASDTMLHEGFHPILDFLESNYSETINDFFAELEAIPGSEDIIAQARENYDGDVTQKKEAITDFVAGVADGRILLNPSNFRKIRKFLLDMLNKIGIGKGGGKIMEAKDTKGLIRLAEFVTEVFTDKNATISMLGGIKLPDLISGEQVTFDGIETIVGDDTADPVTVSNIAVVDPIQFAKVKTNKKAYTPVDVKWVSKELSLIVPKVKSSLYNIVSKSGGAIVVTNSDATGVGMRKGVLRQGGIGYTFIKQNVEDKIGFAASMDSKQTAFFKAAQEAAKIRDEKFPEMKGKPVAVFVMVQAPEVMFGNAYGAEYFIKAISNALSNNEISIEDAKSNIINYFNSIKESNATGKKYANSIDALIQLIQNTNPKSANDRNKIYELLITNRENKKDKSAKFGFDARRVLFGQFFNKVGPAKNKPGGKIRDILGRNGFNHKDFYDIYGDENVINTLEGKTEAKKLADGGFIMTGFFVDPTMSEKEYVKMSRAGTFQHKQFNGRFAGTDPFVLDGKYYVNEVFPEARFIDKNGKPVPVTTATAGSMYPRTKSEPQAIVERAKAISEPKFQSQKAVNKEIQQRTNSASEKLKQLFNRGNIPLSISEAKQIVSEVIDWTTWYDGISNYVNNIFGEYSEDVLSLLPLSSQRANSATTVAIAINNAEKIYKGEKPGGLAEYYGYVTDFIQGKGIESDKMYNFFKAITGDKDAIAVDMHVWSIIMGKDPNKDQVNPKNKAEFERAKEFVNLLSAELGLAPREVQAALWAANILRTGGKPDSYEEYFEKQLKKGLSKRIEGWRNEGYKPFSEVRKARETVRAEGKEPQFQKAPIKWEKSKEGKGDPSISLRNPIVAQAAKDLKEGKITNEEYRATVSANSPITPITRFFEPATEEEIKKAVKENMVKMTNQPIQENTVVGLRLDIPAYKFNNTWVVSVHEGRTDQGPILSYRNVGRITDVTFEVRPQGGLGIAAGKEKTTIARMYGNWKNVPGNTMEEQGEYVKGLVQDIVNDPSYVQVGMNPFRHSYFYDRSTNMGRPIVSADEVVQIGGLVYAKNPEYGNWTDEAYRVKGLFDAAGAPVQFQKAPTKAITKGKFGGVKKMYKEQVRYGLLGKEGVRLKEKMSGELSAELATAETRVQEAMKTIKKYGGAVTEKDISDFMEGKTSANQLPLDLATQLTEMRAQIDGLTERLIQLGVIDSQESIDYYRENKGKYLLRSYEAINFKENPLIASFTGKGLNIDNVVKKLKNVDQTVVNSALRYLSNRAKAKYIIENALKQNTVKVVDFDNDNYSLVFTSNGQEIAKIPKDSGDTKKEAAVDFMSTYLIDPANIQSYNDIKSTIPNVQLSDDAALEEAKIDANSILDNSESYVMSRGLTGSTNVKSLRQRKDLSPEIRALMGEYTDPLYNYYSTIFKISSLTSSRQYLNSLKEFGMGKFFFDKKTADATKMFAGEASEALKPLNGIYTFPEIYESLKVADKETTGLISQVAGRIRMFKTVYNPSTHVKNIIGNMGFAVSNGHWTNLPEAYKYMRSAITGKTDEDIMNMMDTLNRYGVLNNVIGVGELKAYFDKNESVDDFLKTIYNNANSITVASKLGKAKANLSKIPKAIEKAYAIEDDVFKILAFVNESNRYSKATFGVNYNKLSADQKKEIDNIASEIVKDTYPTFSRVPKGVKTLSKVAFIGNFLAFPVESVRTQYNSLSLAVKEIRSGNPKLKTVGYTRLGGAVAYNSLFASLSMYAYNLAGAGITGAVGMLFGDDEEENETSNAIKKNLAPWNKNSDVYISKFKDGMLEYYDIGSLDSYGYQRRVWNAFWSTKNKGEFDQMMASGVGELLDPWMTKDFVIDNYMKLSSNDNGRGGTIYNPEGKPMDKFTDMSLYVGKQFGPGAVGSAIKVADAYQKGEYEKVMDELGAQVFARRYSVDLNKQFQNYIYTEGTDPKKEVGFKYRLQNAQKIYTDAKRQKLSPLELSKKYGEALDAYKEILLTANEYYKAAALGGTNPKLLIESLKKSRIGSAEAIAIITGSFGKYDQAYIRK